MGTDLHGSLRCLPVNASSKNGLVPLQLCKACSEPRANPTAEAAWQRSVCKYKRMLRQILALQVQLRPPTGRPMLRLQHLQSFIDPALRWGWIETQRTQDKAALPVTKVGMTPWADPRGPAGQFIERGWSSQKP